MPRLHLLQTWQSTNCLLVVYKPVAARQRTSCWLRGGALQLVEKMTWTVLSYLVQANPSAGTDFCGSLPFPRDGGGTASGADVASSLLHWHPLPRMVPVWGYAPGQIQHAWSQEAK